MESDAVDAVDTGVFREKMLGGAYTFTLVMKVRLLCCGMRWLSLVCHCGA